MFALYVHIPYCTAICPYCDFNVYPAATAPEESYVDALRHELRHAAGEDAWRGRAVQTIYLGGGTPSLFTPASIERLLSGVRSCWSVAADAEITLEATPESITRERMTAYAAAGINRVSLGLQSMQPHHLRRLGRLHTVEQNHLAFDAVRAAGIANLTVDLIFAVPGQTLREWESDLAAVAALGPEHVSAYNLTYEERTPFFAWRARGELAPQPEEIEEAMFLRARELLPAAGFEPYEISSFARPGRRSRHNQSYWNGTDYLGVGAGAHSYRSEGWGVRWSNRRLPRDYMERVASSGEGRAEVEHLDRRQAMGEVAFLSLRRSDGLDRDAFARRFGESFDAAFPCVADLRAEGLLESSGGRERLTPRGLLVADSVFASFL